MNIRSTLETKEDSMEFMKRHLICVLAILSLGTVRASALVLGSGESWLTVPSPSDFDGVAALGDMNGDGRADLVVYNQQTGYVRVGYSTGSGFQPLRTWSLAMPIPPAGKLFPFALGNVRGDAADELIIFTHGAASEPGAAQARVTFQTAPNRTRTEIMNGSFCASDQTCAVADLDGNGYADLIAFTQDFGLAWTTLATGSGFGPNAVWHNFFCVRGEVCALGDVDGDGRADAIAFKPLARGVEKGNVLVAPSTGRAFGPPRLGHGFFCIDAERCLVGDVNNDGRDDILLVKGFQNRQAEVLASLSNGRTFINASPFRIGLLDRPSGSSGFGYFLLGDVTGDGRADLVHVSTVGVLQAGGSHKTVGTAYVVHRARAAGAMPPEPGAPPSSQPSGVEKLVVANCDRDRHELTYWIRNGTTGEVKTDGPHPALYSDNNTCPDPNQELFSFEFKAGHIYEFTAVDPAGLACGGQNDPDVVGCQRYQQQFLGAANGRTASVMIPAGLVGVMSLRLDVPQSQSRLAQLREAGIDFSVQEPELLDWLGNEHSEYMQFSAGLVYLLEGRKLKRPVYVDVVFHDYGQLGGKVEIAIPEGNLDAEKVRSAIVSAHNVRYGENVSDWTSLLEDGTD